MRVASLHPPGLRDYLAALGPAATHLYLEDIYPADQVDPGRRGCLAGR